MFNLEQRGNLWEDQLQLQPEEEKNWPFYLKERFLIFNNIQNLNFEEIIKILDKNKNLITLDLLKLISSVREPSSIPDKLLAKFFILVDDDNILNKIDFIRICRKIGSKKAIEILKSMVNNDDFVVLLELIKAFVDLKDNQTAWEVFAKLQALSISYSHNILEAVNIMADTGDYEKISQIIEPFKNDDRSFVRLKLVRCLVKINNLNEALNILEYLKNESYFSIVGLSILEILYEINKETLAPELLEKVNSLKAELKEKIKNSNELWDRLGLAEKLLKIHSQETDLVLEILKNVANILKGLSEKTNLEIYHKLIDIAAMVGPSAFEILSSLKDCRSKDIKIKLGGALAKIGKIDEGLEILEEIKNDSDKDVVREIEAAIFQINLLKELNDDRRKKQLIRSLILRQEPFFANPIIMSLERKQEEKNPLLKLSDIVVALRNKFPELIGLSVLGSLSKGYWLSTSDLDWGLIVNGEISEELVTQFESECRGAGFELCYDNSLNAADISSQPLERLEIVFSGIFIGDRARLREIQKRIIKSISPEKWDLIRDIYNLNQIDSDKMKERFGLSWEEVEFIITARNFLWGLPDYETAKTIYQ